VLATVTVHAVAVYPTPLVPYVAVTEFPVVVPKFVPVIVIVAPPAVGIVPEEDNPDIAGGVYDTVNPVDAALACARP
jgi:hypothetical protein